MKTCKKFGHQYEASRKRCPVCKAEYKSKYYEANKVEVLEYERKYREANKAKIAEYDRKYRATRKANDPLFKLRCNISSLIGMSYNNKCFKKTSKTAQILGCDFETLQAHLIATAIKTYGFYLYDQEYEIDHKTPISTATNEQEMLALNHYTNLQLLYPVDNLQKSDKLDWKINAS